MHLDKNIEVLQIIVIFLAIKSNPDNNILYNKGIKDKPVFFLNYECVKL